MPASDLFTTLSHKNAEAGRSCSGLKHSEGPCRSAPTPVTLPVGARVLLVCDDEPSKESLKNVVREAGVVSETTENTSTACDRAKSGQFQVVISSPLLSDGSWRRVKEVANRYDLGLEVIVLGRNLGNSESSEALREGAFEVLKRPDELPKAARVVKTALWAAYLKGAGPHPGLG